MQEGAALGQHKAIRRHRKTCGTYATNERRDEGNPRLCASDGLAKAEQKREVAVDAVVTLKLAGCLDTLPR